MSFFKWYYVPPKDVRINGSPIGLEEPVYFIAEAGVNHNGDLELAKDLIDMAAESGADAVKFQTFNPERLVTENASKAGYQENATEGESQRDMLEQYELDKKDHEELIDHCEQRDITFLSTPFDEESADLLKDLGLDAIKVGSGELDNHPFLKYIAGFGRPMIVSTGMGTMAEVEAARETIRSIAPDIDLVFLHCTSAYPASMDEVNLRAMITMIEKLPELVGYSDHTTAIETPGFATAAGACVLEKHFTVNSSLPGPDHEASLEPDELDRAIDLVRSASIARGRPEKEPTQTEKQNKLVTRKSLHAAQRIPAGTTLNETHIKIVRPADGISPTRYWAMLGSTTANALELDQPITEEDLEEAD